MRILVTGACGFVGATLASARVESGTTRLRMKEMGSRYLFIVLYVWLERYFSRGDYLRRRGDGA